MRTAAKVIGLILLIAFAAATAVEVAWPGTFN